MSPLERNPARRAHFSRLGWLRWRASSRLDLLLYAAGWTVQRHYLRLRAALPRRPGMTRPADAAPEAGPVSIPLTGPAGTASADPPRPAEAVPLGSTRDAPMVIRAGGVLLPDRMRETPEPMGFRIPPYYLRWERQQAARRWLP